MRRDSSVSAQPPGGVHRNSARSHGPGDRETNLPGRETRRRKASVKSMRGLVSSKVT